MAQRDETVGRVHVTQCQLCKREFDRPMVLDCVHTFCLECLKEYARQHGKNPGQRFQCPVCAKNHLVPDGGMEDLPKNIFMEHLLEIHHLENANLTNILCQVCDLEDDLPSHAANSNQATVYCLDCRQYHCARCSRHHTKQRFSQSHEMVELGKRISADVIKRVKTFCDHHKDKQVEFYCYDCRITFCMSCYVVKHNGHRSCDIGEISEQFYRNVEEDIGRVTKVSGDCVEEEKYLEIIEKEFQRDVEVRRAQIRSDAAKLRRLIDEEEQKLLIDLEKIQQTNLDRIKDRMHEIQRYISMLDNFKRYIIEVKDKATPADVSRIGCSLHDRANELHTIPYDVDFVLDTIDYAREDFSRFTDPRKNVIGSVSVVPQVVDGHGRQVGECLNQNMDNNGKDSGADEPRPGCSEVKIKEEPLESTSVSRSQPLMKVMKSILKGNEIQGIAEVKGALYIIRKRREEVAGFLVIEVYDLKTLSFSLNITVFGLETPVDMTSCAHFSCLYISDSGNNCVFKVILGSNNRKKWPVNEQPGCLSVNRERNVLVTCSQANLVKEFTTDGNPVRNVFFNGSGFDFPIHTIQLESGLLAMCHGSVLDDVFRVCITDIDGILVESFSKPNSDANGRALRVTHLAVFRNEFIFVADGGNRQILSLMAADLECQHTVVSKSGLRNPFRMLFVNDSLYVVDNFKDEGQVLVCECVK